MTESEENGADFIASVVAEADRRKMAHSTFLASMLMLAAGVAVARGMRVTTFVDHAKNAFKHARKGREASVH